MNNNVAIGEEALFNAIEAEDCICIGKNAGLDLTNEKGYIRIGNFTDKETMSRRFKDCIIFQDGKVVIKKNIFEFLGFDVDRLIRRLDEKQNYFIN